MIAWRLFKQFPKIILVLGIFVTSTGLFIGWWYSKHSTPSENIVDNSRFSEERSEPVVPALPGIEGNMLLADRDLYQLDSGILIFKDWFKEELPARLFYVPELNKLIARYPRGLARIGLDGRSEASIGGSSGLAINSNMTALFVKDHDIWEAKIDLFQFKLVDEHRITTTGGFMDRSFADNILMRSEKALIVRNLNQNLRVNMLTGEVKSVRGSIGGMRGNISPDGNLLVVAGSDRRQSKLALYNVETDEMKMIDLPSRQAVVEILWISNSKCAFIVGLAEVRIYDRDTNQIGPMIPLPFQSKQLSTVSPTGRFVFCSNLKSVGLLDLDQGKAVALGEPAQSYKWIGDDLLISARDVADSGRRGTWLRKIGEEERRVSTEPFLRRNDGGSVLTVGDSDVVFFATQGGLFKMGRGDSEATMFAGLAQPVSRFLYIEKWKH